MAKEKQKTPTFMEEVARRREIFKKSEEFRKRITAIKIPEVRRAN